ncbi:MAG TPA: sugar isomerase [Microscillaceae bacterium]|nr:sugar isomerase [Microscillaceae bacterium]
MNISSETIANSNQTLLKNHQQQFDFLAEQLGQNGVEVEAVIERLRRFQVTVPSWALGTGGTRFGRFAIGGEPRDVLEKIQDVGLLHLLSGSNGAISLHIPWDQNNDYIAVQQLAQQHQIRFDAINSNTFQDQPGQKHSYKFGSLSHTQTEVRQQAIEHHLEVIKTGEKLGCKALTLWLGDGSNFPGQVNFQKALERTEASMQEIYAHLPADWQLLVEYKPFEPAFYSMVIPDWGTALMVCQALGEQAKVLVDLGHHLPNANIEQIVARLLGVNRLGGFHFNDAHYADDDLTTGAIKPYRLFLIFCELVNGVTQVDNFANGQLAWMIDASHNTKDPLEDLLQATEGIMIAYAQALLIDQSALAAAQENNEVVQAQEILQAAFRTDVRPLVAEARYRNQASLNPLHLFRTLGVRQALIKARGNVSRATGL